MKKQLKKNQRESDWLIYQKNKFSSVGYSYKSLSRASTNQKIVKERNKKGKEMRISKDKSDRRLNDKGS